MSREAKTRPKSVDLVDINADARRPIRYEKCREAGLCLATSPQRGKFSDAMSVALQSGSFNFEKWKSGLSGDPVVRALEFERLYVWLRSPGARMAAKSHEAHMAWRDLVERYQWDTFTTHTYRADQGVGLESNDRNFRRWLFEVCRDEALRQGLAFFYSNKDGKRKVGGPWINAYKAGKREAHPVYVRGVERTRKGRIHCHALIRWPDMLPGVRRRHAARLWLRRHGFAKVLAPKWQGEVSRYVTKYVTKEGSVDLSRWFDRLHPKRESWDRLRVLSCEEQARGRPGRKPSRTRA